MYNCVNNCTTLQFYKKDTRRCIRSRRLQNNDKLISGSLGEATFHTRADFHLVFSAIRKECSDKGQLVARLREKNDE